MKVEETVIHAVRSYIHAIIELDLDKDTITRKLQLVAALNLLQHISRSLQRSSVGIEWEPIFYSLVIQE